MRSEKRTRDTLQALVSVLHRRSEAEKDQELGFLEVAAYAFAAACTLRERFSSAHFEHVPEPPDQKLSRPQDFIDFLRDFESPENPLGLYHVLRDALVRLESTLELKHDGFLERIVPIESLKVGGEELLGGTVELWRRPASLLADLRRRRVDRDEDDATPRNKNEDEKDSGPPMSAREHPSCHLRTLAFLWRRQFRVPQLERVEAANPVQGPLVGRKVRWTGGVADFRIALCPLDDKSHPLFAIDGQGGTFQALRQNAVHGFEELVAYLDALVDLAAAKKIHLLLLPELMIDPPALARLRERMAASDTPYPWGVVAGSFHFWPEEEARLPYNQASLLDQGGDSLWIQRKRGRFRITPGDFKKAKHFFRCSKVYQADPGRLKSQIFEAIEHGRTLRFLDTVVGRLAILICADAIEPSDQTYDALVLQSQPDLVLMVSMSPKTRDFDDFSRRMSRHGIGTIFVNAACVCEPDHALAMVDLALFEPSKEVPPGRLRWLRPRCPGTGQIEYFDWHGASGDTASAPDASTGLWRPVEEHPLGSRLQEVGVAQLKVPKGPPVIVLDLGAQVHRAK